MKRTRKILFVVGSLSVGGAERQLAMLAEQLVTRGWRASLFTVSGEGPLRQQLNDAGVVVHDGSYNFKATGKLRKVVQLLVAQWRLFRLIRRERPDVLHAFLPLTSFMGAVAGRMAFVPLVVISKRALGTHQDRHPRLKWLDHVANSLSHVVTANSRAVAEDTARRDSYPLDRIHVIPNGLDFTSLSAAVQQRDEMRMALGLAPSDIAIVFVANLIPYKGHAELVRAMAQLKSRAESLKLFLVGEDRGIGDQLRELARSLNLTGHVVFLGRRSDVPPLLAAMDIGVMASHEEGFSNALLEKLATGLPVVATDVGGNAEALKGMADCRLAEPKNAASLAREIEHVVVSIEAARAHRSERRTTIRDRHSVAEMVDRYETLYLAAKQTFDY